MGEDSASTVISSELSDGNPNLLQQLICSAVTVGDGGLAAIVGAYKLGSLSLSDTCFANRSTSWHSGMKHFGNEERDKLIFLVSLTIFISHCFVCLLYSPLKSCSPAFLVATER